MVLKCFISAFPTTNVLIVGGYNNQDKGMNDVEVLSVNSSHVWNYTCSSIPNFPRKVYRAQAILQNSSILICGGYSNQRSCTMLKSKDNKWIEVNSMKENRDEFAMANNNEVAIAVGGTTSKDSAELYKNKEWTKIASPTETTYWSS